MTMLNLHPARTFSAACDPGSSVFFKSHARVRAPSLHGERGISVVHIERVSVPLEFTST